MSLSLKSIVEDMARPPEAGSVPFTVRDLRHKTFNPLSVLYNGTETKVPFEVVDISICDFHQMMALQIGDLVFIHSRYSIEGYQFIEEKVKSKGGQVIYLWNFDTGMADGEHIFHSSLGILAVKTLCGIVEDLYDYVLVDLGSADSPVMPVAFKLGVSRGIAVENKGIGYLKAHLAVNQIPKDYVAVHRTDLRCVDKLAAQIAQQKQVIALANIGQFYGAAFRYSERIAQRAQVKYFIEGPTFWSPTPKKQPEGYTEIGKCVANILGAPTFVIYQRE